MSRIPRRPTTVRLAPEALESRDVPGFLLPVGYWASYPGTLYSADLNHDGCRDVVASHNHTYSFMSVLLGDCTGKLGPEAQYSGTTASYGWRISPTSTTTRTWTSSGAAFRPECSWAEATDRSSRR